MRTAVFGISTSLLLACAPDWSANQTTRCTESVECGEAQLCYRGFCVIDPDAGSEVVDAGAGPDAGTVSVPVAAPSSPAPSQSATTPSAVAPVGTTTGEPDATSSGEDDDDVDDDDDEPDRADAGRSMPDASSAGAGTSGAPDAGSGSKPAMQPSPAANPNPGPAPKPPTATPSEPPATGNDAGATEPDIPGDCTLAKCCEEALKALEEAGKGGKAKGPGKCGCAEPELLRVLGCGLLVPVRALL